VIHGSKTTDIAAYTLPDRNAYAAAKAFFLLNPKIKKLSKKEGHGLENDAFLKKFAETYNRPFSHSFINNNDRIYALAPNSARIGKGAVGSVKPCYNNFGERFAVKVVNVPDQNAQVTGELRREKDILTKLKRVIAFLGMRYKANKQQYPVTKRKIYLVQTFVDGTTVHDFLLNIKRTKCALNKIDALNIAMMCVDAIMALHQQGVLHLDISSKNLMISNEVPRKIIPVDFGTALEFDPSAGFFDDYEMSNYSMNSAFMKLTTELMKEDEIGNTFIHWTPSFDVYCLHTVFEDLGLPLEYQGKRLNATEPNNRPTLSELKEALKIDALSAQVDSALLPMYSTSRKHSSMFSLRNTVVGGMPERANTAIHRGRMEHRW